MNTNTNFSNDNFSKALRNTEEITNKIAALVSKLETQTQQQAARLEVAKSVIIDPRVIFCMGE